MAYDPKKDPYSNVRDQIGNFAEKAKTVTKSDSTDLASYAKALIVTVGGNLVIIPKENADVDTVSFTGLTAGQVIPIQVRRVLSTGTTATVAALFD
jgi:hypothetical protein